MPRRLPRPPGATPAIPRARAGHPCACSLSVASIVAAARPACSGVVRHRSRTGVLGPPWLPRIRHPPTWRTLGSTARRPSAGCPRRAGAHVRCRHRSRPDCAHPECCGSGCSSPNRSSLGFGLDCDAPAWAARRPASLAPAPWLRRACARTAHYAAPRGLRTRRRRRRHRAGRAPGPWPRRGSLRSFRPIPSDRLSFLVALALVRRARSAGRSAARFAGPTLGAGGRPVLGRRRSFRRAHLRRGGGGLLLRLRSRFG